MKVVSINDRITDKSLESVAAYPLQGFFVIEYSTLKVFYNQEGREVFRVIQEEKSLVRTIIHAIRNHPR